jgi:hypothetical protein
VARYEASAVGASTETSEVTNFTLSGFEPMQAFLGDGTQIELPTASITTGNNGESAVLTLWLHHKEGGRLASVTRSCIGSSSCSISKSSLRIVPDTNDLPGFLGLGPMLGSHVVSDSMVEFSVRDLDGDHRILWKASVGPRIAGEQCLWLDGTPSSGRAMSWYMAPLFGRILACNRLPFPALLEYGEIQYRLLSSEFEGTIVFPAAPNSPQSKIPCNFVLPSQDRYTLPVQTYWNWAKENDSAIRDWIGQHPQGVVFPGYGRYEADVSSDDALVDSGYGVDIRLLMFDPQLGELSLRKGSETHFVNPRTGIELTTRMNPSKEVHGIGIQKVGPQPQCENDAAVDLENVTERLVRAMKFDGRRYNAYLAPELFSAWQDSWFMAHWGIPAAYGEEPRLFVSQVPGTVNGIAQLVGGAIDPTTGWIRWMDREPSSASH